ncbi:MAG: hypothetical protein Q8R56_18135 [Polaromonas sp.]|nr:hypothetical protein [Polaromonas sp.]
MSVRLHAVHQENLPRAHGPDSRSKAAGAAACVVLKGLGCGRGLKNNFAGGYMHHPDFLARRIIHTFDRDGNGQRAVSVKVAKVGRWEQAIHQSVCAFNSVLSGCHPEFLFKVVRSC